ncbi:DUF6552 family protein [Granulosicoccus antarcticus]|uniref:Uncharacterized protein n=1 Tax=Granulosicoccus antarcticus IMCC3135 TaxID=1192854 RepID=A0A2Z2NS28_9GAMM|nr:hypothetical protein IMCC3135_16165 [Granulosicoccus antarcticus IMCC3135]
MWRYQRLDQGAQRSSSSGLLRFDWTPRNACLFLAGVARSFVVGVLWNDRALMLIHAIALIAMLAGLLNR